VVGNALVGGGDFILEKGLAVVGFLSFDRSTAMFKNRAVLRRVQKIFVRSSFFKKYILR
jgi:hypothetical protein